MARISVEVERTVGGAPERVLGLLADYAGTRAQLWPEMITDYRVVEGGEGAGTRIAYRLHATKKRIREVEALVSAPSAGVLLEADQRSSLRTQWSVRAAGAGGSTVTALTTWDGAGGVGGFFEKTFAPIGIRKLSNAVLDGLEARLR
ncbi:polyketide cyclase [Parafrankia colletiae]|uniref:Polyketide cyclase n=2 Tax=Actinomycetes TaxID=1760 RepID=A0A1S1Q683_9ACTN|nr:SRPBCC family protein [Parafrankia colletiae]MCK9903034.1 SRPBCC family protein [Frankia sp. Cpl3]OHV28991.1 polyketide cyclase [Parafrankia colletiae]